MKICRKHLSVVPILLVLASCGGSSNGGNPTQMPPTNPGPSQIQTTAVYTSVNLSFPVALVQAPNDDSRWFAIQRAGRIQVFNNDPNATESEFLNIAARVDSSEFEAGLLGIAFHPNFASNGQVFVSYTRTGSPFESVISRFTSLDGNLTLNPTTEEVILTVDQDFINHNGGNIVFGPGGYLFAGFGDGGSGNDPLERAQDTTYILGSIIRIDVDGGTPYAIPGDNPFAQDAMCGQMGGSAPAPCAEIYAWGLRNPWRFSFDSMNGDLWVGDVGQAAWEEVDRVELGMNYGWDEREGANCNEPASGCSTAFVDPITEYGHSEGNSITGGYVYRGTANPTLQGQYIFGDFGSGRIWSVPADSPIGTTPTELANTTHQISSFGEDVNGEIYVLDYGPGTIHLISEL